MNNEKLTLLDIANAFAEKQGMSKKDAEAFVKGMFDLIEEALANEKYVKIKGWGMFKLIEVDSRESINVNTGERFEIQGHTKISFTPESALKELINKPFAHFETVILNEGTILDDTNEVVDGEDEKSNEVVEQVNETILPVEEPLEAKVEDSMAEAVEEVAEILEESIHEEKVAETIEEKAEVSEEISPSLVEEPSVIEETSTVIETALEEEKTDQTEIIENIPMDSPKPEEEKVEVEEKTNWGLIIITILLILIILSGAYWLFKSTDEPSEVVLPLDPIGKEVIETTDSMTIDTFEVEMKVEEIEEKKVEPIIQTPKRLVASIADTTDYVIVGTKTTHILESGETIIRVALKHFGDKNFWPYIAKYNESRVKDANNVPVGTELLIPELKPKQ